MGFFYDISINVFEIVLFSLFNNFTEILLISIDYTKIALK